MEIKDAKNAVQLIQSSTPKEAARLLGEFEKEIIIRTVKNAWEKIRGYITYSATHRKNRVKNEILGYSEESGMISVREFNRWFQKVENVAMDQYVNGDDLVKECAAEIIDAARNSLEGIKLDYRMNYSKED